MAVAVIGALVREGGEMDGQRFDRLARAAAGGASRRRVLVGLAGGVLAALGLGRQRAGAQSVDDGIDWTGRFCGGFAGIQCPVGYACVDTAGDGCDPAVGAADCAGVCQPVQVSGGCAGTLCVEGSICCDVCGEGTCVPAGSPCPLALCTGEECNGTICGAGEYCCNYSCGICAPLGGGCTEQFCGGEGVPCGDAVCGAGEYCCNPSCGICAPLGGACIQIACI